MSGKRVGVPPARLAVARGLRGKVGDLGLGLGAPAAPGWSVLGRVLHGGGAGGAGDGSEGGTGGGTPVEVDGGASPPFLR
ncbi:hypothetical protein C0992_009627 [Termitomyces sp. T32_za158]|nr:hypothetical protein C0992_009627 [Termitomyces sp. T32_za158]